MECIEKQHFETDKLRIANDAESTVLKMDRQRMLDTRREAELDRLAGDLPDDPKALWMYAEHSLAQAAICTIDAGRALIKLKETLPYGEFGIGLEERGISSSTANTMMNTARKFSERSENFLKLGRSKLYACLEFTDEELDALEEGESVLGHTLDEYEKMTNRELRAALKSARSDNDVKEKLLADKNQRIDELAAVAEKNKGKYQTSEQSMLVQQVKEASRLCMAELMTLMGVINQVEDGDHMTVAAIHAAFEEMRATFAAVREAHLIRFPQFHMAVDDSVEEVWCGQQVN